MSPTFSADSSQLPPTAPTSEIAETPESTVSPSDVDRARRAARLVRSLKTRKRRSPTRSNLLVLAVDRLNADSLGAYGNAWIETPAFDALAAESVVFDSYFASSLDLSTLYRALWRGESPARIRANADGEGDADVDSETAPDASAPPSLFRLLKEVGYRTFVVSDVESVALHPAIEGEFCDDRLFLGSPDASRPAETLETTRFFRNFEELARFIVKLEDRADDDDPAPWFVWAHFSGWNERWDFPLDRRERYREDEDDPAPYAGTLVPFWPVDAPSVPAPASASLAELPETAVVAELADSSETAELSELPADPVAEAASEFARLSQLDVDDRRQAVVEAYCGGVAAFDETLEGFLSLLRENGVLSKTLLAFLSTRGLSTGTPGALGVEPAPDSPAAEVFGVRTGGESSTGDGREGDGSAPLEPFALNEAGETTARVSTDVPFPTRFYSEEVALPLAIRLPDGTGATVRLPALCEPRDVFATLRDWPTFAAELASPDFWRFESTEISPFAGRWSADVEPTAVRNPADVESTPAAEADEAADDAQTAEPGRDDSAPVDPFAAGDERAESFAEDAPDVPGRNLLRLLPDESGSVRDRIVVVASDAASVERALVVDDWFFKASPTPLKSGEIADSTQIAAPGVGRKLELFVRPDDRFCVNDVSSRRVETTERFDAASRRASDVE